MPKIPVKDLFYTHKWQLIADSCRIGQEHAKVLMRNTWPDDCLKKATAKWLTAKRKSGKYDSPYVETISQKVPFSHSSKPEG